MGMRERIEKVLKQQGVMNFTQLCGWTLNIDPMRVGTLGSEHDEYLIALKQLLDEGAVRTVLYPNGPNEDENPIAHAEWVKK